MTPVEVPDDLFGELRQHFDERALVELTAMIALENMRARFNRALHIESDSLCRLPDNHPVQRAIAAHEKSFARTN